MWSKSRPCRCDLLRFSWRLRVLDVAITAEQSVFAAGMWPQGDIRDPLGVWGARRGITGDASGGSIKVGFLEVADRKAALVYACYSAHGAGLTGTHTDDAIKCRLLTNWPNVDPIPGVQGYGSAIDGLLDFNTNFTAPNYVVNRQPLVWPNDRFMLLFDPRPSGQLATLVELEIASNIDLATYTFEVYGYFWDRSVLNAPGGPRHPGSS